MPYHFAILNFILELTTKFDLALLIDTWDGLTEPITRLSIHSYLNHRNDYSLVIYILYLIGTNNEQLLYLSLLSIIYHSYLNHRQP